MKHSYKAPLILVAANVFYVCSFSLAKALSLQVPIAMIMLFRFLAGPVYLGPYVALKGQLMKVQHRGVFALRIACGVSAMTCLFLSFKYGDIGTGMMLFDLSTVWAVIGGYLIFGSQPHRYSLMMIPLALWGMYLVLQPEQVMGISKGHFFALLGSFFNAGVYLTLKKLRNHYDVITIVLIAYMFSALILAMPAIVQWEALSYLTFGGLVAMSSLGFLGQLAMTAGFKYASAGVSSLLMLSIIPLTSLSGMLVFGEVYSLNVWIGMGMMLVALGVIGRWQ